MFNSVIDFSSPLFNPTFHRYDNNNTKKFNYFAVFYVKIFALKY